MAWDSSALLFAAVLCGGMMAAASASTVAGQSSTIASFSNAAVAAVVVGTFAVFLARTRSAEKRDFARETVLRKTAQYEIITRDRGALEAKIEKMRRAGTEQLVVVSDFDMTLTSFLMPDGSRGMSTHGILERSGYFGEAFTTRAKQIFNKYYPIEVDPNIDPATKWAAMSEWWETTHGLMVAEGLTKSDIKSCVAQGHFAFRDGVQELLGKLAQRKVPVMVFSAGIANMNFGTFTRGNATHRHHRRGGHALLDHDHARPRVQPPQPQRQRRLQHQQPVLCPRHGQVSS